MFSFFNRFLDALLSSNSALDMYEKSNPDEARRLMLMAATSWM